MSGLCRKVSFEHTTSSDGIRGGIVIKHKELYLEYIQRRGVGANDVVASSPRSYVSYLNSLSRLIDADVTPDLLRTEDDITVVLDAIDGRRAPSTLSKYRSAMRQYAAMVRDEEL